MKRAPAVQAGAPISGLLLGFVFAADEDGAPGEMPDGGEADNGKGQDRDAHNDTGKLRLVMADSS